MYVPVVPHVPHVKVVNKTIVYSDTVLSLNEIGYNLIVTSIEGVSESALESCIKTIFQSNPTVIFNTIQYSKTEKKVYFYTNQAITTEAYKESKFFEYKPLISSAKILEEAQRVLSSERIKDNNCVSLYDVANLLKKLCSDYDNIIERYQAHFKNIIRARFSGSSSIVIYDFDYENKILKIGFYDGIGDDYDKIWFAKENGNLYITKSGYYYTEAVFEVLSSGLSDLYDELLKFADYNDDRKGKVDIKAVNSNFGVNISKYGVAIKVKSQLKSYIYDFNLHSPSNTDEYHLGCNSSIVIDGLKGKEDEIFKRIFVQISDCPEWSQAMLYEFRQNQLAEEQRIEDENKYQEMKRQKRLELKRKIFPFLKK